MSDNIAGSNPMKKIKIEKIVIHCGTIKEGNIEHSKLILKRLTNMESKITVGKKRNKFGGSKGKPMGCMITIRKGFEPLLKRLLEARDNKIPETSLANGNFSFGIKEYIDIPGMEYEPNIGMLGMDVCVTLARAGYPIKRKRHPHKLGKKHMITKEETMEFVKSIGIDVV